jgi:4-alpha-glucanotransferase
MSNFFDSFRIDHILGFFRIWEIPSNYVQGLGGHFNPALPLSEEEINQYGLTFDKKRFTTPHINECYLAELFGDSENMVRDSYLARSSSHHFVLKPFCNTQAKIAELFKNKQNEESINIRNGLMRIAVECLFLKDKTEKSKYHPRISASDSYLYKELDNGERFAFDHLYRDFFYNRHNDFWKEIAYSRLTPLLEFTKMLPCGEDLGMIPDSVPEVMNKLQILSLEIERMPKTPNMEFTDLSKLPYMSVCTTSTHDMAPLRNWWKEADRDSIQRYYNGVLHREGDAPEECTPDIVKQIIRNHLASPSMLVILPLQDWMAADEKIRRADYEKERINVPSNPDNYWRYRMHINVDDLYNAHSLNSFIHDAISLRKL